jgi:succinoglycan biosynthesis protein ExoM
MGPGKPHISVCICTFKRPLLLEKLLTELSGQNSDGAFSFSVVVADNDCAQSAEKVVSEFASRSSLEVTYCVEPQRNIALVRNKALDHAKGDFVAFIDDDEYPRPGWLAALLRTCLAKEADGVLGPVMPYFDQEPPRWATRGRFFEKNPPFETGYILEARHTRTSNVIFKRCIIDGISAPFRAKFGMGGEDSDFFWHMIAKGCVFVWCNEAVVLEAVPAERCTRRYLWRRAFLNGSNSLKSPGLRNSLLVKSFIAVPVYGLALPFLFIAGDHHFVKYMIKLCDHAGRLLALFRITPIKEYK